MKYCEFGSSKKKTKAKSRSIFDGMLYWCAQLTVFRISHHARIQAEHSKSLHKIRMLVGVNINKVELLKVILNVDVLLFFLLQSYGETISSRQTHALSAGWMACGAGKDAARKALWGYDTEKKTVSSISASQTNLKSGWFHKESLESWSVKYIFF